MCLIGHIGEYIPGRFAVTRARAMRNSLHDSFQHLSNVLPLNVAPFVNAIRLTAVKKKLRFVYT